MARADRDPGHDVANVPLGYERTDADPIPGQGRIKRAEQRRRVKRPQASDRAARPAADAHPGIPYRSPARHSPLPVTGYSWRSSASLCRGWQPERLINTDSAAFCRFACKTLIARVQAAAEAGRKRRRQHLERLVNRPIRRCCGGRPYQTHNQFGNAGYCRS